MILHVHKDNVTVETQVTLDRFPKVVFHTILFESTYVGCPVNPVCSCKFFVDHGLVENCAVFWDFLMNPHNNTQRCLYEGESGVFEDDSLKLRNAKGFKEKPQPTA